MDHFAGIDVSLKESSVCVVDANGKVFGEVKVATEPEAMIGWLQSLGVKLVLIGLEAGPLSQWLYAAMTPAGLAVVRRFELLDSCPQRLHVFVVGVYRGDLIEQFHRLVVFPIVVVIQRVAIESVQGVMRDRFFCGPNRLLIQLLLGRADLAGLQVRGRDHHLVRRRGRRCLDRDRPRAGDKTQK